MSMPPMPFEYEGRDVVARFVAGIFDSGRRFDLVPTRANGQPAFGAYLRAPTGIRHGTGLYVLTLTGDHICAMSALRQQRAPMVRAPTIAPEPIVHVWTGSGQKRPLPVQTTPRGWRRRGVGRYVTRSHVYG